MSSQMVIALYYINIKVNTHPPTQNYAYDIDHQIWQRIAHKWSLLEDFMLFLWLPNEGPFRTLHWNLIG